jgi:hypothetical protein
MKQKNTYIKIALHIFFWIIVGTIFTRYSYIRPGCGTALYKEILCVVMIAMVVYLNRFILFPKLYIKGNYLWFWIFNISLLLVIGFLEILLVKSNIYKAVGNAISGKEYLGYLINVYFLVTLRYAAIFSFFYIRMVNEKVKFLSMQQQKLLALENKQIFLNLTSGKEILLTIDDITYISVDGNYSVIHLINKQKYKQVVSLSQLEEILPEYLCLRINRNTIIMYNYVCEYNANSVTVRVNDIGGKKIFTFYQNKNEIIFDKLKKYVTSEIKKMNCEPKKDENYIKLRTKNDVICELNEISNQILELIQTKPNIFASEIKAKLAPTSERTIDNYLRQLKDLGLIEYKGASKTGGYYLV